MYDAELQGLPQDVQLKMRRATQHLQTLNAQFTSFGERDPYSGVVEMERRGPNEADYVVRMKVNRYPLPEWSLTIGECLQNLRSALDYSMLALWRKHSGEPETVEDVQFPIYDAQRRFRKGRERRIGGVHPDVKRIVRLSQPYQRRDDPDGHPLMLLHRLNNHDKHRLLHTTNGIVQQAGFAIAEVVNAEVLDHTTPQIGGFDDGDEIVRFRVRATAAEPQVKVNLHHTYGVAFDKEGPGRGEIAADLLQNIRLYVRDTLLAALKPHF